MKQQSSLVTTLLVILESIAVVGFLFLIFAVSSSANFGKHHYTISVFSQQEDTTSELGKAVIAFSDNDKGRSLQTDEHGLVEFRTRTKLEQLVISADGHHTHTFSLTNLNSKKLEDKDQIQYAGEFFLQAIQEDSLEQPKIHELPLKLVNANGEPVKNALVTLRENKRLVTIRYNEHKDFYPLRVQDEQAELSLNVTAPEYAPVFDQRYQASQPVIELERLPNLNLPFQFGLQVYAESEASAHAKANLEQTAQPLVNDAQQPQARKAVRDAEISMNQGAVIQEALGTFQVFSKKSNNEVKIHAPGYESLELKLNDGEVESNRYTVYMKPQDSTMDSPVVLKITDAEGKPMSAGVMLDEGVIQKQGVGVYHLQIADKPVNLTLQAMGFVSQNLTVDPLQQREIEIQMQAANEQHYEIAVKSLSSGKVLQDAVVTILSGQHPVSGNTDAKGIAKLQGLGTAEKVMVAAPGYLTQTFELPKTDEKLLKAEFALRYNPMSTVNRSYQIKVIDGKNRQVDAQISADKGFVQRQQPGEFHLYANTRDVDLTVTAPGFEAKQVSLAKSASNGQLVVKLDSKHQSDIDMEIGDRLILSKGTVYRVVQPVDANHVRVYRRTQLTQGKFEEYPKGKVMTLAQFNQEVRQEMEKKHFFENDVWITVYALNKTEYLLFKNKLRHSWSEYKLVYANER